MAISTNSVIHYTKKFDNLLGIICNQSFKIKYCVEDLDFIFKANSQLAVNMVSFCDIPLSEVKNHIDSYGSYGIGLSKTWAKKEGLNPVLYVEKDSNFALTFTKQFERMLKLEGEAAEPYKEYVNDFFEFCKYIKLYEGPLKTGKINEDNYRFYDEREWRFSLSDDLLAGIQISGALLSKEYLKDKEGANKKLEEFSLKFSFVDISYIIVDDESEIPDLLKCLDQNFEDKCTARDLKILSTKILTKNQICNDF